MIQLFGETLFILIKVIIFLNTAKVLLLPVFSKEMKITSGEGATMQKPFYTKMWKN